MAQIIDCYSATAGGSSTMYYYRYADDTSAATRIYTGDAVRLPADYGSRITNHMYPLTDPKGWMFWYHVQNIQPVYRTIADACTPPSRVSLNAAAGVLTITGGDGGDLNEWTGFGVGWRERRINESGWGPWSADSVVDSRRVNVSVNSGMVRQYRVRTLGAAGSDYYSAYVVCATLLNGNTAAGTPVILLPLSGTETCAPAPVVKIECPAEPDGDRMTLERSLDGGAWTAVASLSGSGGEAYDPVAVGVGSHTVRYRLKDAAGETSGEDGIAFTRVTHSWKRAISTGDVIANREISFVSDISELLERVNGMRTFYGLNQIVLPGTPGRLGDWQKQLSVMQTAVDECRQASGRSGYGFVPASDWPVAQEINQLREAIENT